MTIKVYMICEPEYELPVDFDISLMKLCARNGINYGTARNTLTKTNSSRLNTGFVLERVTYREKIRYPEKFFDPKQFT